MNWSPVRREKAAAEFFFFFARRQDLYNYQMALQEIDNMRVDGKFRDSEGNIPEGQLVSLILSAPFAPSLTSQLH